MNFMKIGNRLINLDLVTEIIWLPGQLASNDKLHVRFGSETTIAVSREAGEAWPILCRLAENGITRS